MAKGGHIPGHVTVSKLSSLLDLFIHLQRGGDNVCKLSQRAQDKIPDSKGCSGLSLDLVCASASQAPGG